MAEIMAPTLGASLDTVIDTATGDALDQEGVSSLLADL